VEREKAHSGLSLLAFPSVGVILLSMTTPTDGKERKVLLSIQGAGVSRCEQCQMLTQGEDGDTGRVWCAGFRTEKGFWEVPYVDFTDEDRRIRLPQCLAAELEARAQEERLAAQETELERLRRVEAASQVLLQATSDLVALSEEEDSDETRNAEKRFDVAFGSLCAVVKPRDEKEVVP
jgi:hypothetical protein